MSKKTWLLGLWLVVALSTTVPVKAGQFDFALLGGRHSVDVNIDVDGFDLSVLIKSQGNRLVVPIDSLGNMTNTGDFQLEETRRSYSEISVGYRVGVVTPFIGYSTKATLFEKRVVAKNELTGKNEIVSENDKETHSGLSLGLYFGQRLGDIGIGTTLAVASGGVYGEAKIKYYINDFLTLLGGGIYHPDINTTGFVIGLGISY